MIGCVLFDDCLKVAECIPWRADDIPPTDSHINMPNGVRFQADVIKYSSNPDFMLLLPRVTTTGMLPLPWGNKLDVRGSG